MGPRFGGVGGPRNLFMAMNHGLFSMGVTKAESLQPDGSASHDGATLLCKKNGALKRLVFSQLDLFFGRINLKFLLYISFLYEFQSVIWMFSLLYWLFIEPMHQHLCFTELAVIYCQFCSEFFIYRRCFLNFFQFSCYFTPPQN